MKVLLFSHNAGVSRPAAWLPWKAIRSPILFAFTEVDHPVSLLIYCKPALKTYGDCPCNGISFNVCEPIKLEISTLDLITAKLVNKVKS